MRKKKTYINDEVVFHEKREGGGGVWGGVQQLVAIENCGQAID